MRESRRLFLYVLWVWHAVFAPLVGGAILAAVLFAREQLSAATVVICLVGAFAVLASVCCAWYLSRKLEEAHAALGRALDEMVLKNTPPRIESESRYLIEPAAAALDRCREPLRSRFAELQASTEQLRTVLNSMAEGVIAVDDAQRVLLVNDSAATIFRLQPAAVLNRPIWEQVRNHKLTDALTEALTTRRPVAVELELLIPPPARFLQVRASPLSAHSLGGAGGAIIVASDVTELRHLENVRQQFVSNASHELKTPLASIRLSLETLLAGALDDPENAVHFLQTAEAQTDRLQRLVSDMLSLTRAESEQLPLQLRPLAVGEVVARCLDRLRPHAERKHLSLTIDEPPEPVYVLADDEALQQILDNLLDNAIKYTNPQGRIAVRFGRDQQRCWLAVEDSGIGIPQSQLSRIFERFYRVDAARSRELGGTGLGLSIVKHFVQALRGSIDVQSQVGRGTTFTISLPAALPGDTPEPLAAMASSGGGWSA